VFRGAHRRVQRRLLRERRAGGTQLVQARARALVHRAIDLLDAEHHVVLQHERRHQQGRVDFAAASGLRAAEEG